MTYRTDTWDHVVSTTEYAFYHHIYIHCHSYAQLSNFMCNQRRARPGRPAVLVGDLNVAHRRIDYYNPDDPWMKKQAGTTADEQNSFSKRYLENGFVDTFRDVFPEEQTYSYFSPRKGAVGYKKREGLRIDYVLVGREAIGAGTQLATAALQTFAYSQEISSKNLPLPYICDDVWSPYSDHCPVGAVIPL